MKRCRQFLFAVHVCGAVQAQVQPSHGPKKGYLLITGGATEAPDFQRFIEMA